MIRSEWIINVFLKYNENENWVSRRKRRHQLKNIFILESQKPLTLISIQDTGPGWQKAWKDN